jgi:hypothetical protein
MLSPESATIPACRGKPQAIRTVPRGTETNARGRLPSPLARQARRPRSDSIAGTSHSAASTRRSKRPAPTTAGLWNSSANTPTRTSPKTGPPPAASKSTPNSKRPGKRKPKRPERRKPRSPKSPAGRRSTGRGPKHLARQLPHDAGRMVSELPQRPQRTQRTEMT